MKTKLTPKRLIDLVERHGIIYLLAKRKRYSRVRKVSKRSRIKWDSVSLVTDISKYAKQGFISWDLSCFECTSYDGDKLKQDGLTGSVSRMFEYDKANGIHVISAYSDQHFSKRVWVSRKRRN